MTDGSLSIAGPNTLSQATIRAWWGTRGNARLRCSIDQLIAWYLSEGAAQGIRGDVAFAQAIQETGHFTNTDTSARNNFAGIMHYNNAPAGLDFADPQTGIRAHIQLLEEVVNGNGAHLAFPKVAPNWAGPKATTWSGLDGHWAVPGVGYGNTIVAIWNQIAGGTPPAAGASGAGIIPVPPAFPPPPTSEMPHIDPEWQPERVIDNLKLWNGSLDADGTARLVIGGGVDLAHDRLSEYTFTCADTDLAVSGRFGSELGQTATFGPTNIPLTAAAVEIASGQGGPETTVTLRCSIGEWLARDKGPLTESNVSATDFLSHRVSDFNTKEGPSSHILAGFNGQPTASRAVVQRTAPVGKPLQYESSWDLGKRLAAEEGFWFFESAGRDLVRETVVDRRSDHPPLRRMGCPVYRMVPVDRHSRLPPIPGGHHRRHRRRHRAPRHRRADPPRHGLHPVRCLRVQPGLPGGPGPLETRRLRHPGRGDRLVDRRPRTHQPGRRPPGSGGSGTVDTVAAWGDRLAFRHQRSRPVPACRSGMGPAGPVCRLHDPRHRIRCPRESEP